MMLRLLGVLLALTAAACSASEQPPLPKPAPVRRGLPPPPEVVARPEPVPNTGAPSGPTTMTLADRRRLKETQRQAENTETEGEQAEGEEEKERDYSAELAQSMGSPSGCLKPRPRDKAPAEIAISLTAKVMPSGAITHGSVSSAALDPSELECIEGMLVKRRLSPPIEDAPRTVSTVIRLEGKGGNQ